MGHSGAHGDSGRHLSCTLPHGAQSPGDLEQHGRGREGSTCSGSTVGSACSKPPASDPLCVGGVSRLRYTHGNSAACANREPEVMVCTNRFPPAPVLSQQSEASLHPPLAVTRWQHRYRRVPSPGPTAAPLPAACAPLPISPPRLGTAHCLPQRLMAKPPREVISN